MQDLKKIFVKIIQLGLPLLVIATMLLNLKKRKKSQRIYWKGNFLVRDWLSQLYSGFNFYPYSNKLHSDWRHMAFCQTKDSRNNVNLFLLLKVQDFGSLCP